MYANVSIELEEMMYTESNKNKQTENYDEKAHFKETFRK